MYRKTRRERLSDAGLGLFILPFVAIGFALAYLRDGAKWSFNKLEWLGSTFREVSYQNMAEKAVDAEMTKPNLDREIAAEAGHFRSQAIDAELRGDAEQASQRKDIRQPD